MIYENIPPIDLIWSLANFFIKIQNRKAINAICQR